MPTLSPCQSGTTMLLPLFMIGASISNGDLLVFECTSSATEELGIFDVITFTLKSNKHVRTR